MIVKSPANFLVIFSILVASCNTPGKKNVAAETSGFPDSVIVGKKLFESNCVRCHGMDGSGLTGPSLRRPVLPHAPDRSAFTKVVGEGIPGTGMPGNWSYNEDDIFQIYSYILFLRQQGHESVEGDTAKGRLVYDKAGCSACHMLNGKGRSVGPDLSEIGVTRNATYLRQAVTDPGSALPERSDPDMGYGFSMYLPVVVTTSDGKEITGLRVNEDSYTIQLKDLTNKFYSFNKSSLKSIHKEYGKSLMPSYRGVLSKNDIENLVAFLYNKGNP
jgi:putative heme-binding domain-containing protein